MSDANPSHLKTLEAMERAGVFSIVEKLRSEGVKVVSVARLVLTYSPG